MNILQASPDLIWGSLIGTYELRPPGKLSWSPGLLRLYGVSEPPKSMDEFLGLIHPDDRQRLLDESAHLMRSTATRYSHSFRTLRSDGSVGIILDRGAIERDENGDATVIRGFNLDVTDEVHLNYSAERRFLASEERYRKLFDAIDQGFCIVEVRLDAPDGRVDYRVVEANPAFYAQTGFPQSIMKAWLRTAAPGLEEHWYDRYGTVARTGEPVRFESHSALLGRWFDVFAFPLEHPDETLVAILFSDISDRKHQEEQAQLMIGEINHRSRNMLGVIQAIARNTITGDAGEFVARFSERVRALAASNDLLVGNGWKPVALEALIKSQLAAFFDKGSDRVTIDGPPVELSPAATKALGMALHELATNAAKYGALSQSGGRVRIDWSMDEGAGADRRFRMSWTEHGGPPVATPQRRGFGWKVTKQMVEATTRGQVTVDYAEDGLRWQVDCAAANLTS